MKTLLLTLLLAPAFAADKSADKAQADQAAMMKAWTDFATPGDGHKRLEAMVGSWTTKTKFWMAPGAPAQESDGASEISWTLGGRYLQQKHDGASMGKPFHGLGYTAYDNFKKVYQGVWMDDMGTALTIMTGKASADGKKIESKGEMDEVMSKKKLALRDAVTFLDADHWTYEMWSAEKGGKETKMMEMLYTRKK